MNAVRRRVSRELLEPTGPAPREIWRAVIGDAPWRRRTPDIDAALPEALEAVARSLRSGASLRDAVAEVGAAGDEPVSAGLREMAATTARGLPLALAVDRWAAATPGEGVGLAAAALALGAELGGAAARSLDGVADTLRDRNGIRHEVRALSAQARASAAVIVLAPIVFTVLVAAADPSSVTFLVTSPIGAACLAGGVALDAAGAQWMRLVVRGAGRERDASAAEQADVVDLFVLALGAGLNLRLAVAAVARRSPPAWREALRAAADRVDRGQRVSDALDRVVADLGEPARPLVRALQGADRYGSPLLPALERLAVDARAGRRRRAEESARRVPVKLLFPLVLCVLPAFGLLTVAPLLAGALDALRL